MAVRQLFLSAALIVQLDGSPQSRAAQPDTLAPGAVEALQVLADVTLIDGSCPKDRVNFGVVFRFVEEKGVPEAAMMPGGLRRAAFESVLRARRASFDRDELCGEIAENYAEALPGSVSFQPGAGARP